MQFRKHMFVVIMLVVISFGLWANDWDISQNGRITYDGWVGIKKELPTVQLDVNGTVKAKTMQVFTTGTEGGEIQISDKDGVLKWIFDDIGYDTVSGLRIRQSGTGAGIFLQNNTGYVGIATSYPGTQLDINGAARAKTMQVFTTGTEGGEIQISDKNGKMRWIIDDIGYDTMSGLRIAESGVGNALFVQGTTGNIGLGTYTPQAKLHVNGGILLGNTANTNPGTIRYVNGDFQGYTPSGWKSLTFTEQATGNTELNGHWLSNDGGNKGLKISDTGIVMIGTSSSQFNEDSAHGSTKLLVAGNADVQGDLYTTGKFIISQQFPHPDYVFEPDYQLQSLEEVEQYVTTEKHLPGIPSAEEVYKDGIDVGYMNTQLLKKVEELTLYMIEMNKENKELKEKVNKLEKALETVVY